MTTTVVLNGVAVGGTGSQGSNASKTTLQTLTSHFSITAQLTNGLLVGNNQDRIVVYHLTAPADVTAATAMANYKHAAKRLEVVPSQVPGGIGLSQSSCEMAKGGFHYLWLEEPKLNIAGVLTIWLVENELET